MPLCNPITRPFPECGWHWELLLSKILRQLWGDVTPLITLCYPESVIANWSERNSPASLEDANIHVEFLVASRTWRWLPANGQWEAGTLRQSTTNKLILSTTSTSLETNHPQGPQVRPQPRSPPGSLLRPWAEDPAKLCPDSWYIEIVLINVCCFKPLGLWKSVTQQYKTNTGIIFLYLPLTFNLDLTFMEHLTWGRWFQSSRSQSSRESRTVTIPLQSSVMCSQSVYAREAAEPGWGQPGQNRGMESLHRRKSKLNEVN